ncbi:MAG: polysaccharide pyruvyl transferase family protein [Candidatus Peregrinibacteria bacterium]|nr:polysaccharide pyruvyl transferase family protein [Candidatus Peregrinibacteria bacterium]
MKKLLLGNFGAKNLGDELILNFALENYGAEDCIVATADSEFSQKFTEKNFRTIQSLPAGFRSFARFLFNKKYRHQFSVMKNQVDEIIFPGGGLFAIKTKAYLIWFINFLWAKYYFRKPISLVHQGIDEPTNFLQKFILKFVFSRAVMVSVRDEQSISAISEIKNIQLTEDIVCQKLKSFNPPIQENKNLILINARSFFTVPKTIGETLFIAFEESDLEFCPSNISSIFPKTKTELFETFSSAQTAIGERLHFLILGEYFCGSSETFTLKKPYSSKVDSFCKQKKICIFNENN